MRTTAVERLNSPLHGFSRYLDVKSATRVSTRLKTALDQALRKSKKSYMVGREHNELLDVLRAFAREYRIRLTDISETIGVFPKGLDEIALAGFGEKLPPAQKVSFAQRHELGHLFHTLQVRAILLETLSTKPFSANLRHDAELFLELLEGGTFNYIEFEKAVTAAASLAHVFTSSGDHLHVYQKRIGALIDGTERAMFLGKVRFPNGKSFEEVYALFLSRVPLVLGTSAKEALGVRIPALMFATFYISNVEIERYGLDPERLGLGTPPLDGKGNTRPWGFRDLINHWLKSAKD